MKDKLDEMIESLKKVINSLDDVIRDEDIILDGEEEIVAYLESNNASYECIEKILRLMEEYPLMYWGSPGSFVGLVTSFDENIYEKKLLESLNRIPTCQTVWMLNMRINSLEDENKEIQPYIDLMKSIADNQNNLPRVRDDARDFYEYQIKRK